MRLSRYVVVSDKRDDGNWVLFHGITGALDVVTSEVVAGLRRFGDFMASQGETMNACALPQPGDYTPLSQAELAVLRDRGYLTDSSDEEEQRLVAVAAEVLHDEAAKRPSFLVLPTFDCNYRCTYCFERPLQQNLGAPNADRGKVFQLLDIRASHEAGTAVMTPAAVDAMFMAMASVREAHRDARAGGQIVLYGGEPLDAANEGVVRYIVEQGRARGFRFAAITNGHDLHRFIDLLGPGGIEQLQISIDGPERIHNKRRIALGPENSYLQIVRNAKLVLERGDTLLQIRVHLDHSNFACFEELLGEFDSFGWLGHRDVIIYANTVYKMRPGEAVSTDLELHEIDRRLHDLSRKHRNLFLNAPNINLRAKWMPALLDGMQVPLQGNYCSANTGQYVFAPDGHIYSCWESVGKADSRIGSFFEDGKPGLRMDPDQRKAWFSRHVGVIAECRACPMALVCGGGCAQFALYNNKTQLAPYCDNFDAMFRSGLRDMADAVESRAREALAGRVEEGLVAANYG